MASMGASDADDFLQCPPPFARSRLSSNNMPASPDPYLRQPFKQSNHPSFIARKLNLDEYRTGHMSHHGAVDSSLHSGKTSPWVSR